jgi:hypothetical protein
MHFRAAQRELLMEMILWRLPRATQDRPHRLKYRLYLGRFGKTLVRYDNEAGKGDHRHIGADEAEVPYHFSSIDKLLDDFRTECEQLGWRWSE